MPRFFASIGQLFASDSAYTDVRRRPALYGLFSISICLLLAACAGIRPETATPTGLPPTSCTEDISLNGRFSMVFSRDGNEEAVHGSFWWRQMGDHTEVRLLSPLGQTLATIDVRPESAVLAQSGRPPRVAADPDQLAATELGWPLPVSGMHSWLRGCAVDATGRAYKASEQSDRVTTQDGWHIQYVSWQTDSSGKLRPRRIDVNRAASPAGDISIRLVIDDWQAASRP